MAEQQTIQQDKTIPPKNKWRTLKYVGIIALVVVASAAAKMYLAMRVHLLDFPPEQSMKHLRDYIGGEEFSSITSAEGYILAGYHLDRFEWYRFNCSPDEIVVVVANIAARPGAGELDSGTATFEKVEPASRGQQYNLMLNNERIIPGHFARYDPEWWSKDTLDGLAFYSISVRGTPGSTRYHLFYNSEKQMAYLHVVEG
ncbi:MAG TPA: hypothetical protein PKM88_12420 [bacterium]|nr:hypothetical protein [bacterium]